MRLEPASIVTIFLFGYFIWWVPHFPCGTKLVSDKMPCHTLCWYHHLIILTLWFYYKAL